MKQHTLPELVEYAKQSFEENFSSSTDAHPDYGRSSKRMKDGSFLVSDKYSVLYLKPLKPSGYKLSVLISNFKD